MLTIFLPCRAGSQRVAQKNTRDFAGQNGGLLGIKLEQLARCAVIDKVILSTNDSDVMRIGEASKLAQSGKLVLDIRPEHLASSSASTDDVIAYAGGVVGEGTVGWTHVTSPFLTETDYAAMYDAYLTAHGEGYDSLMSVNRLQTFIWNERAPVNYDRREEKWPRTQTLSPLYEINSGFFIIEADAMRQLKDRIGARPYMHVLGHLAAFDIDTSDDFEMGQLLWRAMHAEARI